jgi:hypothetical protein
MKHLTLSIGHRLFLFRLLAAIAVAAIGTELARWTLLDNFSRQGVSTDRTRLDGLVSALETRYPRPPGRETEEGWKRRLQNRLAEF